MDADDEWQAGEMLDGWAHQEASLQSLLDEYPSATARTSHLIGMLDAGGGEWVPDEISRIVPDLRLDLADVWQLIEVAAQAATSLRRDLQHGVEGPGTEGLGDELDEHLKQAQTLMGPRPRSARKREDRRWSVNQTQLARSLSEARRSARDVATDFMDPVPAHVRDVGLMWRGSALAIEALVAIVLDDVEAGLVGSDREGQATDAPDSVPTANDSAADWFIDSLQNHWKWFTSEPEGPHRELHRLSDGARWFNEYVENRVERPHIGWLDGDLHGFEPGAEHPTRTIGISIAAEGLDGPVRVQFADGTETTFEWSNRHLDQASSPDVDGHDSSRDPIGDASGRETTRAAPPARPGDSGEIAAADDQSTNVEIRPLTIASSIDDMGRLRRTRAAIEAMLGHVTALLERDDLTEPDRELGELLRVHFDGYYRMDSPPPITSVDGDMTTAAQLLHRYRTPAAAITSDRTERVDDLDRQIDALIAERPPGDGSRLAQPLGNVLSEASRLRRLVTGASDRTRTGMGDGYQKGVETLVKTVVIAAPVAAVDGLMWLTTERSYVATFIRWIIAVTT